MNFNDKDFVKKYAQIVVKAWDDAAYKQQLVSNPSKVLAGEGVSLPEGVSIKIDDGGNTQSFDCQNNVLTLPLPAKPQNSAGLLADGDTTFSACCCCCCCP
ncbi:MAG: hypothetical protein N3I35_15805 [Clostridia bacterium]|nr:hypothetical protein [Clostridia bacterium]